MQKPLLTESQCDNEALYANSDFASTNPDPREAQMIFCQFLELIPGWEMAQGKIWSSENTEVKQKKSKK